MLLAVVTLAACGGGGDDEATATTTTERATTTVERVTTTVATPPETAGVLAPPEGVTREQADEFAATLATELADGGWPQSALDNSATILQEGIDAGAELCRLADTVTGFDGDVAASISHYGQDTRDALSVQLVSEGMESGRAVEVVDVYLHGLYQTSGDLLCPGHSPAFTRVALEYR